MHLDFDSFESLSDRAGGVGVESLYYWGGGTKFFFVGLKLVDYSLVLMA